MRLPLLPITSTALGLLASHAFAATCTNDQVNYIYKVLQAAGSWSGCAPYTSYSGSTITINWKCTTTSCIPMMQEVATRIPYCDNPTTGQNTRGLLEYNLYTVCKVCTADQSSLITTLWKQAAATSACAPYATTTDTTTSFSWPCSASSCTAVLKDLADKVPDCYREGVNEKARILEPVSECTSVNPSPATPTPNRPPTNGGGGTSTTAPPVGGDDDRYCTSLEANSSSEMWESAAKSPSCSPYADIESDSITISWPCSSTGCTKVMKQLAVSLPDCIYEGNTQSEKESVGEAIEKCSSSEDTPAPTSAYSDTSCTLSEVADTVDLYYDVATSSECELYSTITTYRITITAPCMSPCVTKGFQKLADELEDCYYSYDRENKKEQVNEELEGCDGRRLSSEAGYITVIYESKDPIKQATSSPSLTTSPPKTSESSRVLVPWVAASLAMVSALVLG